MTIAAARGWARQRSEVEWVALAAAIAVFGYLAWDSALWDARAQLGLHLLAIGAILGLAVLVLRGAAVPRTAVDAPILALIATFALATVSALNVGMSLRSMAAIVATAAMLPVALVAIRARPTWVALVIGLPVLALSVPTLIVLLTRRFEWLMVGAPGLPPLRLPAEGTPFGSVAVPPFILLATWALAAIIEDDRLRRGLRLSLLAVGIPLTVLSGSRSAWLAMAAAAVIAVVPWAWRRRRQLRMPRAVNARGAAVGLFALGVAALAVLLVLPRLTAVTSLLYRGALWRDTLRAWSADPLLGVGPGIMPYARQAAAPDFSFPVRQPHSHNLPLGVLGDAGLIGLLAALILVGTLLFVAGPWRSRTARGRTASIVLIGLGIGGLFEDLTFLPGFNLLAIALVAVALEDAGAVSWMRPARSSSARRAAAAAGAAAIGAVLLGAMVVADAGAVAYRAGIDAGTQGRWNAAADRLVRAVEIDPWHPAGPRALAVAADAAGLRDVALVAARQATRLNPGDATAWINLALLCGRDGDRGCQEEAARRGMATARYLASELPNAALILKALGEAEAADQAYRLALLSQPQTRFVIEWPGPVPIGDGTLPEISDPSWQLNLLLARHEVQEPIDPADYSDPAVRALAHAMLGEREQAEEWVARSLAAQPADIRTWDIAIVLRSAWGDDVSEETRIASVVRGGTFPSRDLEVGIPRSVLDIGSFRAYPRDGFVSGATRLTTRPPFPWTLGWTLP